ncbi:MAG: T9SS type A sorting domain-containing protein, partial [Ignavibacteria bacterium]|nr:T9SS type A sorting domain-containing protein [Ignavibacteria bacterium]
VNWILKDSVPANALTYSDSGLTTNTIYHYRVYAYNLAGLSGYSNTAFDTTFAPTGIVQTNEIPSEFSLSQNYPNPFNPSTTIVFQIPLSRGVSASGGLGVLTSLIVYDILGKEVKVLLNQQLQPGNYNISFDGSNLASGLYFYRLTAGEFTDTKRMLLIK